MTREEAVQKLAKAGRLTVAHAEELYDLINTQVITTLVNMYQFGYEVKKEPRYRVKLKNQEESEDYLVNTGQNGYRFYNKIHTDRRIHTRKELEEAGFGWVFDCEGIVIEEVE